MVDYCFLQGKTNNCCDNVFICFPFLVFCVVMIWFEWNCVFVLLLNHCFNLCLCRTSRFVYSRFFERKQTKKQTNEHSVLSYRLITFSCLDQMKERVCVLLLVYHSSVTSTCVLNTARDHTIALTTGRHTSDTTSYFLCSALLLTRTLWLIQDVIRTILKIRILTRGCVRFISLLTQTLWLCSKLVHYIGCHFRYRRSTLGTYFAQQLSKKQQCVMCFIFFWLFHFFILFYGY